MPEAVRVLEPGFASHSRQAELIPSRSLALILAPRTVTVKGSILTEPRGAVPAVFQLTPALTKPLFLSQIHPQHVVAAKVHVHNVDRPVWRESAHIIHAALDQCLAPWRAPGQLHARRDGHLRSE